MKILVIGGSGSLINRLIVRLNKEGQKVFLLSGSRFKNETYERVFERYDFPYSTEQIPEVFESVDPDVTIFTGAYDTLYDWTRQESKVCVSYLSDFINLLMAYSLRRHGRFIYLSSQDVFSASHSERISEETKPDSSDYRGMTLMQAEKICQDYRENQKLDIVTLRIGGMYHSPKNLDDIHEPVSRMCLEAFAKKRIRCRRNHKVAPLSEQDAVQFILQTALADKCEHAVYNISSEKTYSENELASLVAQEMAELSGQKENENDPDAKPPVTVEDLPDTSSAKGPVFDHRRFQYEFGMNRFSDLGEDIRGILNDMAAHPEVFLDDKARKKSFAERFREGAGWFIKALIPILENLIIFIPVFWLSNHSAESRYFSKIDFYLLYVLLFAVVHGQQQAILSALLSTGGYIFAQMQMRSGLDVMVDYTTYIWIAQLFIVGLVVGYMRDRIIKLENEAEEDHAYMSRQVTDIQDINESNVRVKDALETQVITQHDSVGKVYEIVSELDQYSSDEVLFYAARVIGELMHTKDVAIYTRTNGPYARLFTATTKKARSMGNSIRSKDYGAMKAELDDHKVYINRTLDPNLPIMACAIYEQDREKGEDIGTIVMVWGLSWERTTLSEANLLAVICALIQNAVARARRYLEAIESSRFVENTHVMNEEAFRRLLNAHANAEDHGLTQATLIEMKWDGQNLAKAAEELRASIRDTDYIGLLDKGRLCVLLTNTDAVGAEAAMKRMRNKGIETEVIPMPEPEPETEEKHNLAGGIVAGGRA